jgi:hypothetical protein
MKLGTETGSLVNHLHSRAVIGQPEPVAGMGVTFLSWSDRDAGTIFRVLQVGKLTYIETRDDRDTCVGGSGHDGSATYEFKVDVNGCRRYFRRLADGRWQAVRKNEVTGRWVKCSGGLRIGDRDKYRDPSF